MSASGILNYALWSVCPPQSTTCVAVTDGERSGFDFWSAAGEMAGRMRDFDWGGSPLGPPQGWPQSLRVTLRLMLNTRHPMFIWWGPELIQFYNDAYRETMGPERHPSAMGGRGRECWAEIWPVIGPQIEYVMSGKGATWDEDRLVPVTRRGRREDVWWTYSYSPIDVEGGVGGVLVVCNDVTAQHVANESLKDQTRNLKQVFEQAPGFMAILRGPTHVFELTNAAYRQLVGDRNLIGKSVRDAIPEAAGQGYFELLDEVYRTGNAHVGKRMPLAIRPDLEAPPKQMFLDFVYAPIFGGDGGVSGIFVEGADVTERVRNEQQSHLINIELRHRVKNTLAVVNAIASQTLRGTSAEPALSVFHDRLVAFGRAHDILTASTWATASIREVVESALASHPAEDGRIRVLGPPIVLGSKQALSLSLAIHELATNAARYGALSNDRGRVEVCWREGADAGVATFYFVWVERDGPPVAKPAATSFGSRLISHVLPVDFGGQVSIDYDSNGLHCRLTAPMQNLQTEIPAPFGAFA
jgi:two-component sensor histidine kinase